MTIGVESRGGKDHRVAATKPVLHPRFRLQFRFYNCFITTHPYILFVITRLLGASKLKFARTFEFVLSSSNSAKILV